LIEAHGCSIVLRRVEGPEARELFFLCQPPAEPVDAEAQAGAIYRAVGSVLEAEGGGFGSVVSETVFLRHLRRDLARVRAARRRVLGEGDAPSHRPATTEIEQPPLNERARLEVSVQAVLARGPRLPMDTFDARTTCGCVECARMHGLRVRIGGEARLHAAALYGAGADAYEQALAVFGVAEELLARAGMAFRDVARTWIHLREVDRDYAALNRARREFFGARAIDPPPASTGIGGSPVPDAHALCLGIYAVRAEPAPERGVISAPTLNEAWLYGSDFTRGMRMVEANKVALHVSGTASIDEAGRTAHPGDFERQVDRMLSNVAALLDGQGASFADVVSAVTYLKRPSDATRLREKLHEAGYEGFPNALVVAPICRPELLCETEALAVLQRGTSRSSGRDQARGSEQGVEAWPPSPRFPWRVLEPAAGSGSCDDPSTPSELRTGTAPSALDGSGGMGPSWSRTPTPRRDRCPTTSTRRSS
jgi:enamine deaminase RidA (YjgF/YER057c/UK114 family)